MNFKPWIKIGSDYFSQYVSRGTDQPKFEAKEQPDNSEWLSVEQVLPTPPAFTKRQEIKVRTLPLYPSVKQVAKKLPPEKQPIVQTSDQLRDTKENTTVTLLKAEAAVSSQTPTVLENKNTTAQVTIEPLKKQQIVPVDTKSHLIPTLIDLVDARPCSKFRSFAKFVLNKTTGRQRLKEEAKLKTTIQSTTVSAQNNEVRTTTPEPLQQQETPVITSTEKFPQDTHLDEDTNSTSGDSNTDITASFHSVSTIEDTSIQQLPPPPIVFVSQTSVEPPSVQPPLQKINPEATALTCGLTSPQKDQLEKNQCVTFSSTKPGSGWVPVSSYETTCYQLLDTSDTCSPEAVATAFLDAKAADKIMPDCTICIVTSQKTLDPTKSEATYAYTIKTGQTAPPTITLKLKRTVEKKVGDPTCTITWTLAEGNIGMTANSGTLQVMPYDQKRILLRYHNAMTPSLLASASVSQSDFQSKVDATVSKLVRYVTSDQEKK